MERGKNKNLKINYIKKRINKKYKYKRNNKLKRKKIKGKQ